MNKGFVWTVSGLISLTFGTAIYEFYADNSYPDRHIRHKVCYNNENNYMMYMGAGVVDRFYAISQLNYSISYVTRSFDFAKISYILPDIV